MVFGNSSAKLFNLIYLIRVIIIISVAETEKSRKVSIRIRFDSTRPIFDSIRFELFLKILNRIRFHLIKSIFDSIRFDMPPEISNSDSIRFVKSDIRFVSIRFGLY